MYAIRHDVLKTLEESGTKKPFLDFCRLVHSNNFPLDNIAYLLWVEVLRWYTMENTSSMRYSEQTKKLETWNGSDSLFTQSPPFLFDRIFISTKRSTVYHYLFYLLHIPHYIHRSKYASDQISMKTLGLF